MHDHTQVAGRDLAIAAEVWFLVNLMLLPFIGFFRVLFLYHKHYASSPVLARNHLRQTVGVGLVGGVLLVTVTTGIALVGGFGSGYTWMAVILYFTTIHTSLILCGAIGFSKALSGKSVCYPLIGRWFLTEDEHRLRASER